MPTSQMPVEQMPTSQMPVEQMPTSQMPSGPSVIKLFTSVIYGLS
jgi:hypothetical protein